MLDGTKFSIIPAGYNGPLYRDDLHPTLLSAYDTGDNPDLERVVVGLDPAERGTTYLFISEGIVQASDRHGDILMRAGRYAVFPEPVRLDFDRVTPTRVVAITRLGYRGLRQSGGPLEERGRLRYIDHCSDSCLVTPPVLGEPCLNHLHFPPNITQTEHNHPSLRCGLIASGFGRCLSRGEGVDLTPGAVWIIPTGVDHYFETGLDDSLDVIAFHPDSDFGPTHENHPMLNRTWVDGQTITIDDAHYAADVIEPYFDADRIRA